MPSNVDPTLAPEVSGINAGKILSNKLRNVLTVIKSELDAAEARDTTNLDAARAYADAKVAALLGSAPALLDTLNELANALGNDSNFATTMTNALAAKQSTSQKNQPNGYAGLGATGNLEGVNVITRQGTTATLMSLTAPKGEVAVGLNVTGAPEALVAFGTTSGTNVRFKPLDTTTGEVIYLDGNGSGYLFGTSSGGSQTRTIGFGGGVKSPNGSGASLVINAESSDVDRGGDLTISAGKGSTGDGVITLDPTGGITLGGVFTIQRVEDSNETRVGLFTRAGFDPSDLAIGAQLQPNGTMPSAGFVAGAGGTALTTNTKSTGGLGTTAYSFDQVVRAAKLLGWLAE